MFATDDLWLYGYMGYGVDVFITSFFFFLLLRRAYIIIIIVIIKIVGGNDDGGNVTACNERLKVYFGPLSIRPVCREHDQKPVQIINS